MKRLPPNIVWPAAIILLLLSNITVAVGTLVVANARGGVQVIPNYYAEAVAWDSLATMRQDSDALGWEAKISADHRLNRVEAVITDADGLAIDGLEVTVLVSRPQRAEPIGSIRLDPTEKTGSYSGSIDLGGHGLFDFALTATDGTSRFVSSRRIDLN